MQYNPNPLVEAWMALSGSEGCCGRDSLPEFLGPATRQQFAVTRVWSDFCVGLIGEYRWICVRYTCIPLHVAWHSIAWYSKV